MGDNFSTAIDERDMPVVIVTRSLFLGLIDFFICNNVLIAAICQNKWHDHPFIRNMSIFQREETSETFQVVKVMKSLFLRIIDSFICNLLRASIYRNKWLDLSLIRKVSIFARENTNVTCQVVKPSYVHDEIIF